MDTASRENTIDYIELGVRDMADTKAFYASAFGWTFADYGPGYSCFLGARLAGGFTTEAQVPARGVLLVIYAADLAAAERKVKEAGGSIVKEIFSFPGGRRFHFADPSGNELAVWSEGE